MAYKKKDKKKAAKPATTSEPQEQPQQRHDEHKSGSPPISVLLYKINEKTDLVRQLFVRNYLAGTGDEEVTPYGRTLQVVSVPPYATAPVLTRLFSKLAGKVDLVTLTNSIDERPTRMATDSSIFPPPGRDQVGYKVAYVAFATEESLRRVLDQAFEPARLNTEDAANRPPLIMFPDNGPQPLTGLRKYKHRYNQETVNINEMKNEVNIYMADYDAAQERERAAARSEAAQGPDEEGWVTVNRYSGRNKRFSANNKRQPPGDGDPLAEPEPGQPAYKRGGKRRKKCAASVALPFVYNSKRHSDKLNNLTSLKERFEADKKRIAENKAKRKPIDIK